MSEVARAEGKTGDSDMEGGWQEGVEMCKTNKGKGQREIKNGSRTQKIVRRKNTKACNVINIECISICNLENASETPAYWPPEVDCIINLVLIKSKGVVTKLVIPPEEIAKKVTEEKGKRQI